MCPKLTRERLLAELRQPPRAWKAANIRDGFDAVRRQNGDQLVG
jgi:hypothetical protein